ncbi:PA14 domain-containing protein [Planctomycetota bacterium]
MKYLSSLVAFLILLIATQHRHLIAAPIVPGYERFRNDEAVSDSLGPLLAGELNCLSCHSAGQKPAPEVSTKTAPNLMDVGSRVKPDYLRRFIADPTATKPGTTMPRMLHGLDAKESTEHVEALVHYLVSLTKKELTQDEALIGARRRGNALYHEVGCVACHDPKGHDSKGDNIVSLPTSAPHGDLEAKYTLNGLADFLENPLHSRPSGRMPSLNLTRRESFDIAAFLLPSVPERAGAAYTVYRGSWQRLPNFDELKPAREGNAESITASVGEREHFGLRWEAQFAIPESGRYQFHLGADDGARLFIDGKMVIDNDGIHGVVWKKKSIELSKGTHHLQIDYFEQAGGEELYLEIEGPGVKRTKIDPLLVGTRDESVAVKRLEVNSDLVKKGRRLFYSVGCANCHEVAESIASPGPTFSKTFAELRTGRGCLAEQPAAGVPDYDLSVDHRQTLSSFLEKLSGGELSQDSVHSTMLRHNCFACHARDQLGGIEPTRNKSFKTTQPEMGDEGRIPPAIDDVGAKLTAEWLDGILGEGAHDRPYMLTRMPKFGTNNVGHLRSAFETRDSIPQLPDVEFDVVKGKKAGWRMVGSRGFGCIQCHTFGRYKATGVQSIDMTIMTKRLKQNWFRTYVRNPLAFRKGTRMPSAWPNEQSALKDLLDGSSSKQIAAVWRYLDDGSRAKTPLGLVTNSMELIAAEEAIIYRNFIEGAGSRAIGVGYPAGVNLAFDANNLSIALIWQGAFIDAKRHWTGRGQGFEPPKGEKIRNLSQSVSFAALDDVNKAWPTENARELGHKFRGYRLGTDRSPTFMYSVDGVQISDTPSAVESATSVSLQRIIKVARSLPSKRSLYYRAAVSDSIRDAGDGWYELADELKVSLQSNTSAKPIVRQSNGRTELLLPIDAESATITQEYVW